jgi:putative phosphoribosyl transferase
MDLRFRDRRHAGRVLAEKLETYARRADVLVLGLPRGGVPVAFEVATALRAPLDVFLVRKLGVPGYEELAMGAIAPGGIRFINWDTVEAVGVTKAAIERVTRREEVELQRRERLYRGDASRLSMTDRIAGRVVILVDDGLATGSTMRVAVTAVREQRPARVVVAVPVGALQTCRELATIADDVVCAGTPERLHSVGGWYDDFSQTTDAEVRELLEAAARQSQRGPENENENEDEDEAASDHAENQQARGLSPRP